MSSGATQLVECLVLPMNYMEWMGKSQVDNTFMSQLCVDRCETILPERSGQNYQSLRHVYSHIRSQGGKLLSSIILLFRTSS